MATYGKNTDWKNEETYLNNLINEGGWNGVWAQNQMNELQAAKAQYSKPETPSYTQTPTYSNSSGGSSGGYTGGTVLGAYTDTLDPEQVKYLNWKLENGTIDEVTAAMDWIDSQNGTYRDGTLWGRSEPTVVQQKPLTQQQILEMLQQYMPAQPQYTPSAWDETKQKLAEMAINMDYDDWTKSGQYKSLADRYGQQGKMTMQDILGQISSRTGGLASSYATTAAQQQYNDYMAQMEEAARNAYNNERSNAIENAQLAYDYADSDYQRYLDQLSQYNNDRSYAFDLLSKALSESHYADEWQNTLDQQAWERAQTEGNTAYEREQAAMKNAQKQVEDWAKTGSMPNDALIEASGWDRDYVAAMVAYYQKGGKGSYSGTTPSGTSKNTTQATTPTASSTYGESQNIETSMNLPTNVDYSPDEGVIVWNGHRYSSKAAFEDDIENAYNRGNLTSAQVQKILNSLNAMGLKF